MDYVIGLDLGTTNIKALALLPSGEIGAQAVRRCSLHSPQPGLVEQDPQAVWSQVAAILRELVQNQPGVPRAMSLGGAMHSLIPVDSGGFPLAPASTWADQRALPQAQALRRQVDTAELYRRTGCPAVYLYLPARLRWWQENEPQIFRQAARFVEIKDWILFQLAGVWVKDLSLASTTGLLNLQTLAWEPQALAAAGVSATQLPALAQPLEWIGQITRRAARLTGLPQGMPIAAGASDGALANLGAGAGSPGAEAISAGTSGAVRRISTQPQIDSAGRTWCYVFLPGRYLAGGAINNAGLALQWALEAFYPEAPGSIGYAKLFADAAQIPPGANGLILLPYFTGERSPHWNPSARAILAGLGLEHSRAYIARACLEAVAFCLADVRQALDQAFPSPPSGLIPRLTGSITRSPLWVQILADVLGVPLAPVEAADASALGAATLALAALEGDATRLSALSAAQQPGAPVVPHPEAHALYREIHARFQRLYSLVAGPHPLAPSPMNV